VLFRVFGWVCGVLFVGLLWVSYCKSFFSFSFFNKTPYYLSKKKIKKKKIHRCIKKKKKSIFFSIHVESLPEISILLCFDELSPLPKRFKLGLVYTRRLLTLPLPEIDPSSETVPTTSPQIDPPSETISQSSP
jgi:hypothetical protein